MIEEMNLSKAQVRAFESPVRLGIITALRHRKALSARDLSQHVGLAPDRVYYHLNKLIKLNLVESTSSRPTETKPETIYQLTAKVFQMRNLENDPEYARSVIVSAERVLRTALGHYEAQTRTVRKPTQDLTHFNFATGRCSERRIKDLRKRLMAIGLEILEGDESGIPVILAGVFTPIADQS
ncbi:MAG: winged helix-turn-helix transcriptional regulator [Chthonomonas sp.]|nr:winged helix-turn-helix transcriptional regulator [Chthonomonas sp.]